MRQLAAFLLSTVLLVSGVQAAILVDVDGIRVNGVGNMDYSINPTKQLMTFELKNRKDFSDCRLVLERGTPQGWVTHWEGNFCSGSIGYSFIDTPYADTYGYRFMIYAVKKVPAFGTVEYPLRGWMSFKAIR